VPTRQERRPRPARSRRRDLPERARVHGAGMACGAARGV